MKEAETKMGNEKITAQKNMTEQVAAKTEDTAATTEIAAKQTAQSTTAPQAGPQVIIAKSPKSVGIAVLLALFLGPLGMLYSTIKGAIIMFFVCLIGGFITLGFGLVILLPICAVWAYMATNSYNKELYAGRA